MLFMQAVGIIVRESQALTQLRKDVVTMKEELQTISITVRNLILGCDFDSIEIRLLSMYDCRKALLSMPN